MRNVRDEFHKDSKREIERKNDEKTRERIQTDSKEVRHTQERRPIDNERRSSKDSGLQHSRDRIDHIRDTLDGGRENAKMMKPEERRVEKQGDTGIRFENARVNSASRFNRIVDKVK